MLVATFVAKRSSTPCAVLDYRPTYIPKAAPEPYPEVKKGEKPPINNYLPLLIKIVRRYSNYYRHHEYWEHLAQGYIILNALIERWDWENVGTTGFASAVYFNIPKELSKYWARTSGMFPRKDRCGRDKDYPEVVFNYIGKRCFDLTASSNEEETVDNREYALYLFATAPLDIRRQINRIRTGRGNLTERVKDYVRRRISLDTGTTMEPTPLSPGAARIMDF